MIKAIFKSLIAVILLIFLIPLARLLIWLASHLFTDFGLIVSGAVDPLGVAALLLIGVALLFVILAIKS